MSSMSKTARPYTYPYFVRPSQCGQWEVATEVGSPRCPARVTVAQGTKAECEIAAEAWNLLARGKQVRIVVQ